MAEWIAAGGARLGVDAGLERLAAARVALLGERHDSAEDHAWQEWVAAGIAERAAREGAGPVALGFEAFPRRVQGALDAFVAGRIDEAGLLEATGWAEVWGFDPGLYRGLFALCRERGLAMVALNVDRAVVRLVGREGWDALGEAERGWLTPAAPAPMDYRRWLFAVTGGARPDRAAKGPEDPAFDRFVRAQQVWDRAFACAIAGWLAGAGPGARLVGIVGRGHLEGGWGTPLQLADLGVGDVCVALRADGATGDGGNGPPPPDLLWTGPAPTR